MQVKKDTSNVTKMAYRPNELVNVLSLGITRIRTLIKAGDIKSTRAGGAVLVSHAEVERFLREGSANEAGVAA